LYITRIKKNILALQ